VGALASARLPAQQVAPQLKNAPYDAARFASGKRARQPETMAGGRETCGAAQSTP